jgi:hypothetical protein
MPPACPCTVGPTPLVWTPLNTDLAGLARAHRAHRAKGEPARPFARAARSGGQANRSGDQHGDSPAGSCSGAPPWQAGCLLKHGAQRCKLRGYPSRLDLEDRERPRRPRWRPSSRPGSCSWPARRSRSGLDVEERGRGGPWPWALFLSFAIRGSMGGLPERSAHCIAESGLE